MDKSYEIFGIEAREIETVTDCPPYEYLRPIYEGGDARGGRRGNKKIPSSGRQYRTQSVTVSPSPPSKQEHYKMTPEEEAAFQEYLANQNNPSLCEMERVGDRGPIPYSPEAYDEMIRQDAEGQS